MTEKNSYSQILKASSIMGGAAGINMILGMVRVKFAAVLIGTTGVGLLASFSSIQGFIGTVAGLGIQSSAVREVAAAVGRGDQEGIGRAVLTLRRVCWFTGITGMLAMMLLSPLLSQLTFGHQEYAMDIAALGVIILFANVSGGQMALIQGMRRIGDMARANVYGAALGTISAIGFYSWLGLRGIVPSLIVVSCIGLVLSWYFAKRIPMPNSTLTWRQTFDEAGGMVKLGLVFMWNGLLGSVVTYITITLITQYESIQAVGIYSAAFALSGLFVNFVLQAMGADYYPRLTGVADDKEAVNRMVNEQTEIGLLLAVPGLLATLVLAPWVIKILYTHNFLEAVELIPWFVLGCFFRITSWPLGYTFLALNRSGVFLIIELSLKIVEIVVIVIGLHFLGILGVSIAFFVIALSYVFVAYYTCYRITGLKWSHHSIKLIIISIVVLVILLVILKVLPALIGQLVGISITALLGYYFLVTLADKIKVEHKLSSVINYLIRK